MKIRIVDCPDGTALAEVEKAYRRGFSQGVSIARQFLEIGYSISDISRWEDALMDWRRRSSHWTMGQVVAVKWPPDPKQKKVARGKVKR
jgi:hypothetical protein